MKKKLIAVVLSITVIAGVGAVLYNTTNSSKNIEITENIDVIEEDNLSDNKTKTADINEESKESDEIKNVEKTNEGTARNIATSNSNLTDNKTEENGTENKPTVDKPVAPPVEQKPVTPPTENKPQPPVESGQFIAEVEQAIFNMVNQERAKAGIPALSYNSTMQNYARIKSQDMGDRGYFDHNNPEGELITAQMQRDGVSYNAWGENIAYISGVTDANTLATQFMNNWMNSDGHRKNILSTNFSGIGVGVYRAGNKVYATQEFYR